jgi:hypothetical protein
MRPPKKKPGSRRRAGRTPSYSTLNSYSGATQELMDIALAVLVLLEIWLG